MPKYHINPETGVPGACKAKVKCRFGEGVLHYASKEAATQAFEASMEGQAWAAVSKEVEAEPVVSTFQNPNLDTARYEDFETLQDSMSEQELNSVWHLDTIVRDWYFDARAKNLNHEAAYDFAIMFDAVDRDGENGEPDKEFDFQGTFDSMINDYKTGKTVAIGNYERLFDEASIVMEKASRYQDVMEPVPDELRDELANYERMAKTINVRNLTQERLRTIQEMSFVLSYNEEDNDL